jgi:hypothetical protein
MRYLVASRAAALIESFNSGEPQETRQTTKRSATFARIGADDVLHDDRRRSQMNHEVHGPFRTRAMRDFSL